MIGIIYKFTIEADGYTYHRHKPFYVGQHWEGKSIQHFLDPNVVKNYDGGGVHWNEILNRLKSQYPSDWRKYVKREVLCVITNNSQKALDLMEGYWIKKERAHYSQHIGGCNIAWGSITHGNVNPASDPIVRKRISIALTGRKLSDKHKKRLSELYSGDVYRGDKNPNYGHRWSDEMKRKMSEMKKGVGVGEKNPNYKNHWNEEQKRMQSEKQIERFKRELNPMSGMKRITDGVVNKVIKEGAPLPVGFRYGMAPRKKNKKI